MTDIEIKVGQVWQEVDPHFPGMPHKRVVGINVVGGLVQLSTGNPFPRKTWAKRSRFNGKRGGYKLICDSDGTTP